MKHITYFAIATSLLLVIGCGNSPSVPDLEVGSEIVFECQSDASTYVAEVLTIDGFWVKIQILGYIHYSDSFVSTSSSDKELRSRWFNFDNLNWFIVHPDSSWRSPRNLAPGYRLIVT